MLSFSNEEEEGDVAAQVNAWLDDQRIVDAAVELHSTLGPSRATVKAIAERAGVTRPTVYAHFPDDRALFEACSGHVRDTVPPPDPHLAPDSTPVRGL